MATTINNTQLVLPDNNTISSDTADTLMVNGYRAWDIIGEHRFNFTTRLVTTTFSTWTDVQSTTYTRTKSGSIIYLQSDIVGSVALNTTNNNNYAGVTMRLKLTNSVNGTNYTGSVNTWGRFDVYGSTKEEEHSRPVALSEGGTNTIFGTTGTVTTITLQIYGNPNTGSLSSVGHVTWTGPSTLRVTEFFV